MKDIYFDDQHWTVRYFVVDSNKWLPGKKVLLSPISFDYVDMGNETVSVLASKETVKNAPNQHEHEPVSKQVEMDLTNYYGWPPYWSGYGGTLPWGGYGNPLTLLETYDPNARHDDFTLENREDYHLRSAKEIQGDLFGYTVETENGEIGYVSDLVIDESSWKVSYLVIDTKKKLLDSNFRFLPIENIKEISWQDRKIVIDPNVTEQQINQVSI